MLKLGGFRGAREDCADHTNLFPRSFTESGFTKHQKSTFSTFDGKLEGSLEIRNVFLSRELGVCARALPEFHTTGFLE